MVGGFIWALEIEDMYVITFGSYSNMSEAIPAGTWKKYSVSWLDGVTWHSGAVITTYEGASYNASVAVSGGYIQIKPCTSIPKTNGVFGSQLIIPKYTS